MQTISLSAGCDQIIFGTPNGDIECISHTADGDNGIIWVSGARGGFDGPSSGIFATLSRELISQGINSLRLSYRFPGDFEQCVVDTLIGIRFLEQKGVDRIALVGHSFGGAVAIMAGIRSPQVAAVVGLSSQTEGLRYGVDELSPRPLLLIHGDSDRILPVKCSQDIYSWAREPKEIVIYQGSGHLLAECKDELHSLLKGWLTDKLGWDSAATDTGQDIR